jgi:pimeloyl-ACP methyl ester carboxylesterase
MFTDVAGYTALTERDEAAAVRVREQHHELVRTLVHQFDGEVVDATGDESLSVFPSALRAVDCALALQGALANYPDLRVRIGIHLGDVLRHEGQVVGEGVNIAARVRPLAEPGGVAISEPVYQMVRTRPHVVAESLGSQSFKNVGEPVEVYALLPSIAAIPRRKRRWIRASVAGLVLLLLAVGLYPPTRGEVAAALFFNLPTLFGETVEQEIAFVRNPDDGTRVAYATTGQGPVIVSFLGWATHLQDGIGSTMYDAGGLVPLSSRENLFVRFDGRGFGLSDRDVTDFSLDAAVGDLAAVIDQIGAEQVGLYTFSSGGPVAIAYTARHPERVSRLVLAATFASASFVTEERRQFLARMYEMRDEPWQGDVIANYMVDFLVPDAGGVSRRIMREFILRSGNGAALASFFHELVQHDTEDLARQISVPTLVMHSEDDQLVPIEAGRKLASLIPEARFDLVDGDHRAGCGLTPETRQRVLDFLNGASGS